MPFLGDRLRITFKNVLEQYKSDKLGQITGGALFTLLVFCSDFIALSVSSRRTYPWSLVMTYGPGTLMSQMCIFY